MSKESDYWYIGRFCESKFFNKSAVKKLRTWIEGQEWKDGAETLHVGSEWGVDKKDLKNNEEIDGTIPSELFWTHIDENLKFKRFADPKSSSSPICSRTRKGGYYKPHFDYAKLGHFSTTIFLSDPDEYEGGELVLYLDGKEIFFKPKAGRGITYRNGIGHRVNTVTKGERLACIFWTSCNWNNLDDFFKWRYYTYMYDVKCPEITTDTLYEYFNTPHAVLRKKADDIMRNRGIQMEVD